MGEELNTRDVMHQLTCWRQQGDLRLKKLRTKKGARVDMPAKPTYLPDRRDEVHGLFSLEGQRSVGVIQDTTDEQISQWRHVVDTAAFHQRADVHLRQGVSVLCDFNRPPVHCQSKFNRDVRQEAGCTPPGCSSSSLSFWPISSQSVCLARSDLQYAPPAQAFFLLHGPTFPDDTSNNNTKAQVAQRARIGATVLKKSSSERFLPHTYDYPKCRSA